MTQGNDNYPKTFVETLRLLTDYVPPPRLQRARDPDGEGLAFIQGDGGTSCGLKSKGEVECWHCGGPHFKNEYPELLSWKCRRFRCRPQLVLTICLRVFPSCRHDMANVSATSCDVGYFFSVSYVVSLPNCRHVAVVYVDCLRFIR
jgi:hypothetical protein